MVEVNDGALPSFGIRMLAISKALREYSKYEPVMLRYSPLAEKLWDATASSGQKETSE
jgi:hypothetical protein